MRKARSVTQTQLAEALCGSQQTVHASAAGRRRIPVSALPVVASTLAVSLEVLFDKIKQFPPQRPTHAAAKASDEDAAYDWR